MLKSGQEMVAAQREPAQETQNYSKHPPRGREAAPRVYFAQFGFLLGPAPFRGDHFLTTFLAYVSPRPKTIILHFFELWGFGHSRGHGLYKLQKKTIQRFFQQ